MEEESNFNEDQIDETNKNEITGKIEYGIFSGPGIVNEVVPFREFEGEAIAEGDIVLGSVEELRNPDPKIIEQNEEERIRESTGPRPKGFAIADTKYRWPNNTMPYEVDPNLPNASRVKQAMDHITSNTGFKFVKRTDEDDYVYIERHPTISKSKIGKRGGKQIIWLGDRFPTGSMIHELLHAMGIYHEATRPDRDNYIKIHYTDLEDGWAQQYQKPLGGLSVAPYDYCSIMHYPRNGGAKPGKQAFTVLKDTNCTVGQRKELSRSDIQTIKKIYDMF